MSRLAKWGGRFVYILSTFLLACANPPPTRQEIASGQPAADTILQDMRTQEAIGTFVGSPPDLCVNAGPSTRFCSWALGSRNPRWRELAGAIGSHDRINLLCELPRGGGDRPSASCSVFPRRSNRYLYELPPSGPKSRTGSPTPGRADVRATHRETASREIAGARTLRELITLMGAVPGGCERIPDGARRCVWMATSATYGHGTLAFSINASPREKVMMSCLLPGDGNPRRPGSCRLEVPGRRGRHAGDR